MRTYLHSLYRYEGTGGIPQIQYFPWGRGRKLDQVLALGGKDGGHRAVGVELFASVAMCFRTVMDTYMQIYDNSTGEVPKITGGTLHLPPGSEVRQQRTGPGYIGRRRGNM